MQVDDDRWRFGPFVIDRRLRQLLAEGTAVKLDSKAFDLLEYLVARHDEAPSREEILAHVWRGITVSDNNLSVQLSAVRRALSRHGGTDKLILTLPGQRYRFVGDLVPAESPCENAVLPPASHPEAPPVEFPLMHERVRDAAAPAHSSKRKLMVPAAAMLLAAIACIAVLRRASTTTSVNGTPLSIIVLPFRNLSGDKARDYLADAVTDDLTTELAAIPGSLVIARETAEAYRERPRSTASIGRTLNVKYLLEGGVAPYDGVLKINARLIDAETGSEFWARRFTVAQDRLGEAPDSIVEQITATLGSVLVQAESQRSRRDRPHDPEAIDLLLRAKSILDLGDSLQNHVDAQALLEDALAKQPGYADALAELGWVLVCKITNHDDPDREGDQARAAQAIERALALSPQSVRALSAQARLQSLLGDYAAAAASAKAALAVRPNDVDANWALGTAEFYAGELDQAASPLQTSLRIDPEGPTSKQRYYRLGSLRLFQGRLDEAIDLLQRAAAGDILPEQGANGWSRSEKTQLMLIAADQLAGRGVVARAAYESYAARWPQRTVWHVGTLPPNTLSALPGFQRFLQALEQAGMPRYADEKADSHVAPSSAPLAVGDFAATPVSIPGAQTLDTRQMAARLHDPSPKLVIDLGTGTAVIDGAIWVDAGLRNGGDNAFVDSLVLPFHARFPNAPVVVMSDGVAGVTSYNAALHLTAIAGLQAYWYRGGEEAWSMAGYPASYRRRG